MKSQRILSWETHLVQRATAGEDVAFELLADLYRPTLTHLALRLLRNSDDANDAVQETFIKALRALKDFDHERPIKPWLCRICVNCCVDVARNRKHVGASLDQYDYNLQDPVALETTANGSFQQSAVVEAIQRLPDKYRKIIFMRHFRHMDVVEIANALNKPEGTVKSWLFRARTLLKKDLSVALG
jgi:RNA polymerase sigma-70 factor (ECF subfamily)